MSNRKTSSIIQPPGADDSNSEIYRGVYPPTIIKPIKGGGERGFDIFSALFEDRIVMMYGPVTNETATIICAQLMLLDNKDSKKPIMLYINSPGGSVYDGLGIADTMEHIKSPVWTLCFGHGMSMGAYLLAAGDPGHRYATRRARIMIHQPSGGSQGQATEIEISANEILYLKRTLNEDLARFTGKTVRQIGKDVERDNFMSAAEAKKYGLIDHILGEDPLPDKLPAAPAV
jgi:ATP-dependent Clp protease, protease subunit